MKSQFQEQIDLIAKCMEDEKLLNNIDSVIELTQNCLLNNLPLLVCGNGGSASDAMHISGELVGRFHRDRKAFNVICLNSNTTVMTAWSNDKDYDSMFARQVEAHGQLGGAIWGLSTSGNSQSVVLALKAAKKIGMITVGFAGKGGGKIAEYSDILIEIPSNSTPRIQELHLPIYHYICEQIESGL